MPHAGVWSRVYGDFFCRIRRVGVRFLLICWSLVSNFKNETKKMTVMWTSNVARPLCYKNKTTYFFKTGQIKTTVSRPRPPFLKTIKLLTQDHCVAKNFDREGPKLEKFLWRYFGDAFRWRNADDVTEVPS